MVLNECSRDMRGDVGELKRSMESTIDDCFTISDNAGILEEKRLTGYNRDDIMFFVDGSLAQLVEHLTLNQGVRGSNP